MVEGDVITIEVGQPPTIFKVHEKLLEHRGGFFFKGALNGHFKESDTKCIPLHAEDSELFAILVGWFHSRIIPNFKDMYHGVESDSSNFTSCELHRLFRLWILGDKLQIPVFQDFISSCIRDTALTFDEQLVPPKETLEFVFANTVPSSVLRYLAIDIMVLHCSEKDRKEYLRDLSPEILQLVAMRACGFASSGLDLGQKDEQLCFISYKVGSSAEI